MKIDIKEQELIGLYNKAKQAYYECIGNPENDFLKYEVDAPLEGLLVVENDIKIEFYKHMEEYSLVVTLKLYMGDNEIGEYKYIENEKEEGVDDSLVFY